MIKMNHEYFMKEALNLAQTALEEGEFPVGCVISHKDRIIATGKREGTAQSLPNEVDHAEMTALRNLAETESLNEISRKEMTIYCTMEPCLMCFGAILLSGIGKIVYAYEDVMGGAASCDTKNLTPLYKNSRVSIIPGVLRKESIDIFKMYFSNPSNIYWKESILANHTLSQKS